MSFSSVLTYLVKEELSEVGEAELLLKEEVASNVDEVLLDDEAMANRPLYV